VKYYIIYPVTGRVSKQLCEAVYSVDKSAEFVEDAGVCDVVVLQNGWNRSNACKVKMKDLLDAGKICIEEFEFQVWYRERMHGGNSVCTHQ